VKIAIIRKKYIFHGGAEGFSTRFIEHLIRAGHEVHIFAIKWDTDLAVSNVYFHRIPAIRFNSFLRDLSFAISSYFILKRYRQHLDIIQTHDKTLYQDIYRAGDGCHIEWLKKRWQDATFISRVSILLNPYHWLILILERIIFKGRRFKKIIAISRMVRDEILDNYHINPEDIEVIYNGVDLERFHPKNKRIFREEVRREFGIKDQDFVILFVGSGFERKGLRYLIESIELIDKPVCLMIVGKGNERSTRKYIRKQRVIFCGPRKEIYKYYASADVFVFPTLYEPFGNVHLEALASGLPIITTKRSGASEIIENGKHGFVVNEPDDIHEIARCIEYLMDSDRLHQMSTEARRLAEGFSFEKCISEMERVYHSIQ